MSNCQGVEAYLDYLIPAYYLPLISPYVSSYIVYLMYPPPNVSHNFNVVLSVSHPYPVPSSGFE